MNTWIPPTLCELDVQLTEKAPGNVERLASWGSGDWLTSTYAQDLPTSPGAGNFS